MKRRNLFIVLIFAGLLKIQAQEVELTPLEEVQQKVESHNDNLIKLNNLKISGYLQPQFQWGEQSASLKVGTGNTDASGVGLEAPFSRVGLRRGRLKFTYDDGGIASGVVHFNFIDKPGLSGATVQLKEAYLTAKDPWFKTNAIRFGVFDRPFGHEVGYSSSLVESPERSRFITTLFPEESELGAMLVLQAPISSPFNFLKFEGGFFAGNAINPETDNRKDFIGHIVATKPIGNFAKWGLGASYYNGGVYQTNSVVYNMAGAAFVKNDIATNKGAFAKREYFGVDGQFSVETPIGITQIRAEYLWGSQPGNAKTSASPNRAALPAPEDTYIRPMNGWYAILVQDLGRTPFSAVIKYDVYDPNTKVSGNDLGLTASNTGIADVKYSTLGTGIIWHISPALLGEVYYELVENETSTSLTNTSALKNYTSDLKDNTLTVRLQYKF